MPSFPLLDHFNSSQVVLLAFVAAAAVGGALYLLGVVNLAVRLSAWLIRSLLRGGFACWAALLAWMPWPVLLGLIIVGQFLAWFSGPRHWHLDIAVGALLLFIGLTSVMAYMVIDQERYEVARGHKALHNPGKGQELLVL